MRRRLVTLVGITPGSYAHRLLSGMSAEPRSCRELLDRSEGLKDIGNASDAVNRLVRAGLCRLVSGGTSAHDPRKYLLTEKGEDILDVLWEGKRPEWQRHIKPGSVAHRLLSVLTDEPTTTRDLCRLAAYPQIKHAPGVYGRFVRRGLATVEKGSGLIPHRFAITAEGKAVLEELEATKDALKPARERQRAA